MIVTVREWYGARSLRERRLLLLLAALVVPLLAWFAIIVPLGGAYDSALDRQLEAVDRNGRVRALADPSRNARPATVPAVPVTVMPGAPVPDLPLVIAEAATQAGLTLDSTSAAGPDAVAITIAQARPTAAVQWLRDLEQRGIRVEDLRMAPGADGTVSVNTRLVRSRE